MVEDYYREDEQKLTPKTIKNCHAEFKNIPSKSETLNPETKQIVEDMFTKLDMKQRKLAFHCTSVFQICLKGT